MNINNKLFKLASIALRQKLLLGASKDIRKITKPGLVDKLKMFITGKNTRNANAINAIKKYKEINKLNIK